MQRGVALGTWDGDGLRREAAVGLGEPAGHGEPAGEAQVKLLARTVDAGGSLLLRGVELAQLADSGLLLVQGMRSMLSVTLQGDGGAVGGMLAIAADEPEALRPADIGFALEIATGAPVVGGS